MVVMLVEHGFFTKHLIFISTWLVETLISVSKQYCSGPNGSAIESNMTMVEKHLLDKNSSIVITCADTEVIRTFMLAAKRIGMLETGQFVFYNVDLFGAEEVDNYKPWHSENVGSCKSYSTSFQNINFSLLKKKMLRPGMLSSL